MSNWMTIPEAVALLKDEGVEVAESTVRRYVTERKIAARRISLSGRILIDVDELRDKLTPKPLDLGEGE